MIVNIIDLHVIDSVINVNRLTMLQQTDLQDSKRGFRTSFRHAGEMCARSLKVAFQYGLVSTP
jgi:hypothetical protein